MISSDLLSTESIAQSHHVSDFAKAMSPTETCPSPRINLNQENITNGLGKLVLTLIELIRELLERQAIRRIEAGSLTTTEIEKLGTTFMRLAEAMEKLKKTFGLEDDDLNIDLGPLGKIL